MGHDHTIYIQVLSDGTYEHPVWDTRMIFRFRTENGEGKLTYSKEYETFLDADTLYETSYAIDTETLRTRDECTAIRKQTRKQLQAVNA